MSCIKFKLHEMCKKSFISLQEDGGGRSFQNDGFAVVYYVKRTRATDEQMILQTFNQRLRNSQYVCLNASLT